MNVKGVGSQGGVRARPSGFNRFMIRWLASPFGFVSGGVSLVRYVGRISGLRRQLPVRCSKYEGDYLIRVGKYEQQTWWRNFTVPWPIEIANGLRVVKGTAGGPARQYRKGSAHRR